MLCCNYHTVITILLALITDTSVTNGHVCMYVVIIDIFYKTIKTLFTKG